MLVDGAWVPTFPKARYLIGRAEYEHWRAEEGEDASSILADTVTAHLRRRPGASWSTWTTDLDRECAWCPTPGHTPGHVSVAIESQGERALITGDFTHHPCQMAHPEWSPAFDVDPQAAAVLRRRMFADVADQPVLVIGTHFAAPTAGHVKRDGDAFRFEVEASSVPAPTPGAMVLQNVTIACISYPRATRLRQRNPVRRGATRAGTRTRSSAGRGRPPACR